MAKKTKAEATKKTREEAQEIVRKGFARKRAEATVNARCMEEPMSKTEREEFFMSEYLFELEKMEKAAEEVRRAESGERR